MMMASMMGAIAFQKGLGLTHSLAHALSTVADLHHGYANGLMIDHALPFNIAVLARSGSGSWRGVGGPEARRAPRPSWTGCAT